MHMCNHLPDDPKLVLAMRITESSYDIYLSFPAKTHHELSVVLNGYVIVPVDTESTWGWMSMEEFDKTYRRANNTRTGKFHLYEAI